jgi:hypothetical protein
MDGVAGLFLYREFVLLSCGTSLSVNRARFQLLGLICVVCGVVCV